MSKKKLARLPVIEKVTRFTLVFPPNFVIFLNCPTFYNYCVSIFRLIYVVFYCSPFIFRRGQNSLPQNARLTLSKFLVLLHFCDRKVYFSGQRMGVPLIIFFKKLGVPPNHQFFRRRPSADF